MVNRRLNLYQLAIIWILFLALISIPALLLFGQTVYIKKGNLFKEFFREPFESAVFIFKDGTFYVFSTHHEIGIFYPVAYILDYFKKNGKDMKDVAIIVHNHQEPTPFSPGNNTVYHYLKNRGFNGLFIIYYPFSGKIREK